MRYGHHEVALELVRFGEALGHLPKAIGEMPDLVLRAHGGQRDVVVSRRHLVGGLGKGEHRSGEASREVEEEPGSDDEATEEREPDPPDQNEPAVAQLRLGLCDDERSECFATEADRLRDGKERPLLVRRSQLDRLHARRQRRETCLLERELLQAGELSGKETEADVEKLGSSGELELRRCELRRRGSLLDALNRLRLVELCERLRLAAKLVQRLRLGVVLEKTDRDHGRH